jgi:hypothetical protein
VNLYDLGTGHLLRSFPHGQLVDDAVAGSGAVLTRCDEDRLHVLDLATGAEQRSIQVSTCHATSQVKPGWDYEVFVNSTTRDTSTSTQLSAADLRTGQTYRFTAPAVDFQTLFGRGPIVVPVTGPNGAPVALIGDKNLAYRLRPPGPVQLASNNAPAIDVPLGTDTLTTPDGRLTAQINGHTGQITLFDATTHAVVRSVTAPPPPTAAAIQYQGQWASFPSDSKRLLVVEGDSLVVYSVPDLTVERRMDLPVPASLGPPPHASGFSSWASSVLPLDATRAVALHAGVLTQWDVTTGRPVGAPLPLRTDPAGQRRSAMLAFLARQPRPHHADDVIVVEPDGSVEVWRLAQRRRIAKAMVDAAFEQGTTDRRAGPSRSARSTTCSASPRTASSSRSTPSAATPAPVSGTTRAGSCSAP